MRTRQIGFVAESVGQVSQVASSRKCEWFSAVVVGLRHRLSEMIGSRFEPRLMADKHHLRSSAAQ